MGPHLTLFRRGASLPSLASSLTQCIGLLLQRLILFLQSFIHCSKSVIPCSCINQPLSHGGSLFTTLFQLTLEIPHLTRAFRYSSLQCLIFSFPGLDVGPHLTLFRRGASLPSLAQCIELGLDCVGLLL